MVAATIWQLSYWSGSIAPNVLATVLCAIPTLALSYAKVVKPLLTHMRESREHREWQFRAEHAKRHGKPVPEHPHFT